MNAVVRPLTERDQPEARRLVSAAFGTFLGAPDPANFWTDRDYVYCRFGAEHVAQRSTASWSDPTSSPIGAASGSSGRSR